MAVQRMWREKKFLCIDFAGFQFFRQRREHRSLHAAKQSDASQLFHGRRTGYALHGSDWPDESASLAPFMTTSRLSLAGRATLRSSTHKRSPDIPIRIKSFGLDAGRSVQMPGEPIADVLNFLSQDLVTHGVIAPGDLDPRIV